MILLDTHTWVWWVSRRTDLLPESVDHLIIYSHETVAVASVSCLEVAILAQKGRLELRPNLHVWIENALAKSGLRLLELSPEIAARVALVPGNFRDPIDRALIATAQVHEALLVTKDRIIASSNLVRTRWE